MFLFKEKLNKNIFDMFYNLSSKWIFNIFLKMISNYV